ncbi:MAG TPA: DUF4041 domain-containing protein [Symbiobacteriaceae bacterium]|nr:DUF4041 domain-containing protein [Symbiobacteriaceae bacterium]
MSKWYLQTWFIALMFLFGWLVVPLLVGIALVIQLERERKKLAEQHRAEVAERDALLAKYGIDGVLRLEQDKRQLTLEVESLRIQTENMRSDVHVQRQALAAELDAERRKQLTDIEGQKARLLAESEELTKQLEERRKELVILDEELSYQEAGLYSPLYDFGSSERYWQEIEHIRQAQKDLVKADRFAHWSDNWTLNGSVVQGRKMNEQNKRMILRAFNNECDAIISGVNHRNFGTLEKRIQKSRDQLDKLNTKNQISLRGEYVQLKVQELRLVHEYALKKQEEKEEQLRIRELMREAEKVRLEIERQKAKLEKEKNHFQTELAKMVARLEQTQDEAERQDIQAKIAKLQGQLDSLAAQEQEIERYEKNTRAGYVYVISNIGSFGEHVYKIGMTRRLVPEERIDELGDASVPFKFDIHAMIFSEDAPTLEATLHRTFEQRQVNKVNPRKEFFRVSIEDIERVVKQNHDKTVEFIRTAIAEQYRQTLAIERKMGPVISVAASVMSVQTPEVAVSGPTS